MDWNLVLTIVSTVGGLAAATGTVLWKVGVWHGSSEARLENIDSGIERLEGTLGSFKDRNCKDHRAIEDKLDQHGERLVDLEVKAACSARENENAQAVSKGGR